MSATNGNAPPTVSSGGSKSQLKTTTSGKAMDSTRKQAASPIDASQR